MVLYTAVDRLSAMRRAHYLDNWPPSPVATSDQRSSTATGGLAPLARRPERGRRSDGDEDDSPLAHVFGRIAPRRWRRLKGPSGLGRR